MDRLPPLLRPVHDEGSLITFEYYRDLIKDKGYKPVNHAEKEGGDPTHPEHLLWMCEHCSIRVRDDGFGYPVGKYSRWLGFIQGCLIMQGWTTVQEERDRTRPWLSKPNA